MPNQAQENFRLLHDDWNRPKPKIYFWVDFRINQAVVGASKGVVPPYLSLMCQTTDKPQYNLETNVHNQYNRKRVVHGQIKYEPVRMMFYDDVDNSAHRLFNYYRSFYYGDFQNKTLGSWKYDTAAAATGFETDQNWGLSTVNNEDAENSYFFDSINIYEFFQKKFTVYNLIHPKITSFEMDPRDIKAEAISEVTMSLEYEGVTHFSNYVRSRDRDHINYPIPKDLAVAAKLPGADTWVEEPVKNVDATPAVHPDMVTDGQALIHQKTLSQPTPVAVDDFVTAFPPLQKTLDDALVISGGGSAAGSSAVKMTKSRVKTAMSKLAGSLWS